MSLAPDSNTFALQPLNSFFGPPAPSSQGAELSSMPPLDSGSSLGQSSSGQGNYSPSFLPGPSVILGNQPSLYSGSMGNLSAMAGDAGNSKTAQPINVTSSNFDTSMPWISPGDPTIRTALQPIPSADPLATQHANPPGLNPANYGIVPGVNTSTQQSVTSPQATPSTTSLPMAPTPDQSTQAVGQSSPADDHQSDAPTLTPFNTIAPIPANPYAQKQNDVQNQIINAYGKLAAYQPFGVQHPILASLFGQGYSPMDQAHIANYENQIKALQGQATAYGALRTAQQSAATNKTNYNVLATAYQRVGLPAPDPNADYTDTKSVLEAAQAAGQPQAVKAFADWATSNGPLIQQNSQIQARFNADVANGNLTPDQIKDGPQGLQPVAALPDIANPLLKMSDIGSTLKDLMTGINGDQSAGTRAVYLTDKNNINQQRANSYETQVDNQGDYQTGRLKQGAQNESDRVHQWNAANGLRQQSINNSATYQQGELALGGGRLTVAQQTLANTNQKRLDDKATSDFNKYKDAETARQRYLSQNYGGNEAKAANDLKYRQLDNNTDALAQQYNDTQHQADDHRQKYGTIGAGQPVSTATAGRPVSQKVPALKQRGPGGVPVPSYMKKWGM